MQGVSIHAPVKGATITSKEDSKVPEGFNPRTREGCDGRKLSKDAVV